MYLQFLTFLIQCRTPHFYRIVLLTFRGAESAHKKDDKAYQQNQAKSAAADDGTAKVKPAAAKQEKQDNYD